MRQIDNQKVVYPELSYKISGLCFEIQNTLGRFKNEKIYADYFEQLLQEEKIPYKRELALKQTFNGENPRRNIVDFIIDEKIIVDLKAKKIITREDYFQMKRYLSSADKRLGLIVNFRQKYVSVKRVLLGNS